MRSRAPRVRSPPSSLDHSLGSDDSWSEELSEHSSDLDFVDNRPTGVICLSQETDENSESEYHGESTATSDGYFSVQSDDLSDVFDG